MFIFSQDLGGFSDCHQ